MGLNLNGLFDASAGSDDVLAALTAAARERILILDGAMGTQIQGLGLAKITSAASVLARANAICRAITTF